MTAIGFFLFVFGLLAGVLFRATGGDPYFWASLASLSGLSLMAVGIAIKIWEVMP